MSLDGLILSSSVRSSLGQAARRYHETVSGAASYLEGRGLTEKDAVSSLLGHASDPMPGHERFEGMVCIPYVLRTGAVAGLKFRRIDDGDGPKYDSPSGQHARLFNARALADGGPLALICEGEFDAIIAQGRLGVPAVAAPGTTWLAHWSRCFGDFDRVVIVADNDVKEDGSNPGLKHAQKVVKSIEGAELVLPPAGMDMTDWILERGVEAVREAVGL